MFFSISSNTKFSKTNLQKKLEETRAQKTQDLHASTTVETARHILHPYVGFVADPDQNPNINALGWSGPDPIGQRRAGTIRIILFGGSVAQQLYETSKDVLIEKIRSAGGFHDKKIDIYNASLSGYKQPQQLEALAYLFSMGAEFDIVINLDGFNELALPFAENWRNQVAVMYPRGWNFYTKKTINNDALSAMISIDKTRSKRRHLAEFFHKNPMKNSVIALILWNFIDAQHQASEYKNTQSLRTALTKNTPSYQTHGPSSYLPNEQYVFEFLASVWYNSSVQMGRLSAANHALYLHFLQPNQYVPHSKRFTNQEQTYALTEAEPGREDQSRLVNDTLYKQAVIQGYPLLQTKGGQLTSQNISFHDLTQIYLHTSDSIYTDTCCHVNQMGNNIMISEIARIIHGEYAP